MRSASQPKLSSRLDLLVTSKRRKALDEPDLFATYIELTADARDVVRAHVDTLVGQLERIISDGVAGGQLEKSIRLVQRAPSSMPPLASTTLSTRPNGPTPRSTQPTEASERSSSTGSCTRFHRATPNP